MTTNEATIVGAVAGGVIGAITSLFTTRYVIKHGPNYDAKIAAVTATLYGRIAEVTDTLNTRMTAVNATLEGLTKAHTDQNDLQRLEAKKREARRWRPDATIQAVQDASSLTNSLILKSHEQFTLLGVSVKAQQGATLTEVRIDRGQTSTGFRVPISHQDILKVKESAHLGALQNGATGRLIYRIDKSGEQYEFKLPFVTEDVMVGDTVWIKLLG